MAGKRGVLTVMALFSSHIKSALQVLYQFDRPFIIDHSKFEKTFGADHTPHQEAIRRTVAWYREQNQISEAQES